MAITAELRTYQDAIEYLVDIFELDRTPRFVRQMRRAVDEAYRDLPFRHDWSYYRRRCILHTAAAQSTGTVAYTHSSRTVTLSGATFPSNASDYRLAIGNADYEIERYVDSTNVILASETNPGIDVASGTAYNLHRATYDLPVDFRRMLGVYDTDQRRELPCLDDQREQSVRVAVYSTPDTPWWYSLRGTGQPVGKLQITFLPVPAAAVAYDLLYLARPRPIGIFEKYSLGTVTSVGGSADIAGTSTTFPTNCAGAVIRFSGTPSSEPTGPFGALINNQTVDNPFVEQHQIIKRTSATAITLDEGMTNALTDTKYSISDPLDLEPGAMLTAFLKLCELNMARLAGRDSKELERRERDFMASLVRAKEADVRRPWTNGQVVYDPSLRLQVQSEIG